MDENAGTINQHEPIDSFDEMKLKESLLRGIYAYGFETPSLIQSKAIPHIMSGVDLIAQSQSGTGKTGTFTIGTLQRIDDDAKECQAIVIAHTRELSIQIYEVFKNISSFMDTKIVLCIGGDDLRKTRREIENGGLIIIGTPGRIIDLMNKGVITTRELKLLVIDEADEMLSYNFEEQIETIVKFIPQTTQVCLFSATMPPYMLNLTEKFMQNPTKLLIDRENLTLDGIKQFYVNVGREDFKFATFCDLYNMISVNQSIVYVNTIKKGIDLKEKLESEQFTVSLIHSGMESTERFTVMTNFRNGKTRILISTDLLSRGIDIQQISVVVNYDLPKNKEAYIHRIGRSGRYGRKGIAINFITKYDEKGLNDLISFYRTKIEPMPENINNLM